jgi:hypothetical protein
MTDFVFQATLVASIHVKAGTKTQAEQKLRDVLAASVAHLGMLDDKPIIVAVEIEGTLDLIDSSESAIAGAF